MPIKLNTASGGGVILTGANTATDKTITVPAVDATMLTDSSGVLNIGSGQVYKDASGNVGIGTSSPLSTAMLEVSRSTTVIPTATVTADNQVSGWRTRRTGGTYPYEYYMGIRENSTALDFYDNTANALRARIDSSGTLFVGGTSQPSSIPPRIATVANGLNGIEHFVCNEQRATTGTENYFRFYRNNSLVGTITNTLTNTAYNTSSDYRLKENVQPMTGALTKVVALKPCTYTWKVDGSDGEGFIAHELAEVVPGCVTGEKDAVDADGNPVYQGIDTSFLVATLTAAIQEQQQMIETLQAKVAALEAK